MNNVFNRYRCVQESTVSFIVAQNRLHVCEQKLLKRQEIMIFNVEKIDHHQLFKILTIEIFQTIKFFLFKMKF